MLHILIQKFKNLTINQFQHILEKSEIFCSDGVKIWEHCFRSYNAPYLWLLPSPNLTLLLQLGSMKY